MKNRKQMIDDEMGYFFGFPRGCYTEVLGELARTMVNSSCTSSIPLAEFWSTFRRLFAARTARSQLDMTIRLWRRPFMRLMV